MAEEKPSFLGETQLREIKHRDDKLYEKFARWLEAERKGDFVAISVDGQIMVNSDHLELLKMAVKEFGPGNFTIRKIGYPYVLKWRGLLSARIIPI